MRSNKLGYEAPIAVVDKKYYSYTDKNYSLTNSKVSAQDVEKLSEVISILKQFKGFTYFEDPPKPLSKLPILQILPPVISEGYYSAPKNADIRNNPLGYPRH